VSAQQQNALKNRTMRDLKNPLAPTGPMGKQSPMSAGKTIKKSVVKPLTDKQESEKMARNNPWPYPQQGPGGTMRKNKPYPSHKASKSRKAAAQGMKEMYSKASRR
jgi:hypothetical protein